MDFIIQLFPYIIGLIGVVSSFYTVHKTIKTQKFIKSIEIKKEIRTKLLDEYIETYSQLLKSYEELIQLDRAIGNINNVSFVSYDALREDYRKISSNISYYSNKIKMILTKDSGQQSKILSKIMLIYLMILSITSTNDISSMKTVSNNLINEKDELENISSSFVESERTAIEDLMQDKKDNKIISWLKKSWKEVGNYN